MKTIMCIALILISVFFNVSPALAATPGGEAQTITNIHVPEDILAQLDLTDADYAVYCYNRDLPKLFSEAEYKGIDGVLDESNRNPYRNEFITLIQSQPRLYLKNYHLGKNDSLSLPAPENLLAFTDDVFTELLSSKAIRLVDPQIQINECNLITYTGPDYYVGTIIYYETNLGNYIYYQISHTESYLMPENIFVHLMTEYNDSLAFYIQQGRSDLRVGPDTRSYQRYRLGAADFSLDPQTPSETPWGWILAGGILLIVVSTAAILLVKRKRSPA